MYDGDVLQLLRKYKKISQTELAKRIYKSQETISHYEQQEHLNGKNLEQLLQALKSNKVEWNLFKNLPPLLPRKFKIKTRNIIPGFLMKNTSYNLSIQKPLLGELVPAIREVWGGFYFRPHTATLDLPLAKPFVSYQNSIFFK